MGVWWMARRGLSGCVGLLIVSLVLSGCGLLPKRNKPRPGPMAEALPSPMCDLVEARTRDLLVPHGQVGGSEASAPEAGSTVGGSCEVRSPEAGGPRLTFTALRFPPGGATRYSGFPTPAQTYEACAKRMLRPYSPDTPRMRDPFDVKFGDKAAGAYDASTISDGRPIIDGASVCVLSGDDEIEAEYHKGDFYHPVPADSLKQGATLAAAAVLRNLP
jgi:hypothetical protein